MESPRSGGTQLDAYPTEVDPTQDGVDARAFFTQNGTSADATAYLSRTSADLTLTDANAGTKRAQDLVSQVLGAQAAHQSLVDLIHYLDDGPGDGWASGAVCRATYQGVLPLTRTWYTSSAATTKIVGIVYAYASGTPLLATKTWTLYTPAGAVARTLVDTYVRTGPLLTQVTRTWS